MCSRDLHIGQYTHRPLLMLLTLPQYQHANMACKLFTFSFFLFFLFSTHRHPGQFTVMKTSDEEEADTEPGDQLLVI